MSDDHFSLLAEGHSITEIVDDPVFTEVTENGEVYTLYRVVRFTHQATSHPDGWTHRANVVRVHDPRLGVALIRVAHRIIEDARVTLSTIEE